MSFRLYIFLSYHLEIKIMSWCGDIGIFVISVRLLYRKRWRDEHSELPFTLNSCPSLAESVVDEQEYAIKISPKPWTHVTSALWFLAYLSTVLYNKLSKIYILTCSAKTLLAPAGFRIAFNWSVKVNELLRKWSEQMNKVVVFLVKNRTVKPHFLSFAPARSNTKGLNELVRGNGSPITSKSEDNEEERRCTIIGLPEKFTFAQYHTFCMLVVSLTFSFIGSCLVQKYSIYIYNTF